MHLFFQCESFKVQWKFADLLQKGFVEAHVDDGLLEIFGLKQGWHTSLVMVELISAKHIAQVLFFSQLLEFRALLILLKRKFCELTVYHIALLIGSGYLLPRLNTHELLKTKEKVIRSYYNNLATSM